MKKYEKCKEIISEVLMYNMLRFPRKKCTSYKLNIMSNKLIQWKEQKMLWNSNQSVGRINAMKKFDLELEKACSRAE